MSVSPDINPIPNIKSQITPTVDSEREEFRKYLENSGLPVVLTGIFKELYEKEEKPSDPLTYFIDTLCAFNFYTREIAALKEEIEELNLTIKNLEEENTVLREKLDEVSSA